MPVGQGTIPPVRDQWFLAVPAVLASSKGPPVVHVVVKTSLLLTLVEAAVLVSAVAGVAVAVGAYRVTKRAEKDSGRMLAVARGDQRLRRLEHVADLLAEIEPTLLALGRAPEIAEGGWVMIPGTKNNVPLRQYEELLTADLQVSFAKLQAATAGLESLVPMACTMWKQGTSATGLSQTGERMPAARTEVIEAIKKTGRDFAIET